MENLIAIKRLPIVEEHLHDLQLQWEQKVEDARSMVCTEDTIQAVKAFRAEMRKEFEEVDALRKQIKEQLTAPAARLDDTFKRCVSDAYRAADITCKMKIAVVESDIKERCEAELREYFAELCTANYLEWLRYEQAGITVDMASAKAKTPKRLREQLAAFVAGVSDSVNRISALDDSEEIMVEYMRTLDAAGAICTVRDRHRRIDEEKRFREARAAILEQEAEAAHRVEALAPPVVVNATEKDPNEIIPSLTFTCINATRAQLRRVREFLNMEGIKYE